KLVRVKRDANFDGKPDVWEIYRDGRLERMGVDVDGDEHVDRWDHDNDMRRRFEEALTKAPDDPSVRHSLGLLALGTGKGDEAVAIFSGLATEDPERAAFRQGLAEALLVAGRPGDALDAAAEAVRLADDRRSTALAHFTRARAILSASGGRVDTEDCAGTAPPVYAWLAEADRALDRAEATGVPLPELVGVRRSVRQRRGTVDDACPGVRASAPSDVGRKFPGG
ncbi:MAG: tetratricopeptide repeat protein, partial [Myxococcota bacterium]